MDIDDLYTLIRGTLVRKTVYDSYIPMYLEGAVREIEGKLNVRDMEGWFDFTITSGSDPITELPSRFKEIDFVRRNTADAGKRPKWEYLAKGQPHNQISRVGMPERYWEYKRQFLVLDAKPEEDVDFESRIFRYTEFPAEGSGLSHWLLDRAPMLLHAKVMIMMAPFARLEGPTVVQGFKDQYAEALATLIAEEDNAEEGGIDPQMEYWPEHIPFAEGFDDNE